MQNNEILYGSYSNIPAALANTVRRHGDLTFARIRVQGKFVSYSYQQTLDNVKKVAGYLNS